MVVAFESIVATLSFRNNFLGVSFDVATYYYSSEDKKAHENRHRTLTQRSGMNENAYDRAIMLSVLQSRSGIIKDPRSTQKW